jgi:streptogramin lyase
MRKNGPRMTRVNADQGFSSGLKLTFRPPPSVPTGGSRVLRGPFCLALFGFLAFAAFTGCGRQPNTPASASAPSLAAGDDQPRIYVADWANHRIVRMSDMSGGGWITYGERGDHPLRFPVGICVDTTGRIHVAEQYHQRIVQMDDMLGANWRTCEPPPPDWQAVNKLAGSWICVAAAGRIYYTYDGEHRIVRIDDMSGANRVTFGMEGSEPGQFRYPAGIAVDDAGRIYVADFDNFRVVRIDDMQGTNWVAFGSYGNDRGQFINPCGLCLDAAGRIYVADQGNDRIVRIDDMQGANWTTIGSFGTAPQPGLLYAPTGICIDRTGRIYVTQCSSNHRIVRMDDMLGTNWIVFGSGGAGFGNFASPMGIWVQ